MRFRRLSIPDDVHDHLPPPPLKEYAPWRVIVEPTDTGDVYSWIARKYNPLYGNIEHYDFEGCGTARTADEAEEAAKRWIRDHRVIDYWPDAP